MRICEIDCTKVQRLRAIIDTWKVNEFALRGDIPSGVMYIDYIPMCNPDLYLFIQTSGGENDLLWYVEFPKSAVDVYTKILTAHPAKISSNLIVCFVSTQFLRVFNLM